MRYCEEFAALLDPYIDNELSPEAVSYTHLVRSSTLRRTGGT